MGDYAVRSFASLASFETVLRFNRQSQPDILVIDIDDAGIDFARLQDFVSRHFVDIPVIAVQPSAGAMGDTLPGVCLASRPFDGFQLSELVDFLIRRRTGRRHLVRYKDLVLDMERMQCVFLPSEDSVSLPLKEAQILKLMLARPGICLSRDDISSTVWSGVKITPRTIDSHVSRLRKHLRNAGISIESIYGGGYVLR